MAAPESDRRIAFITGASYGIGAEIAAALARDGFDLALAARRAGNVANTCKRVEALGARAFPIGFDVSSAENAKGAVARVVKELGAIDVLVNNAGMPVNKLVLDTTPEEWEAVVATN